MHSELVTKAGWTLAMAISAVAGFVILLQPIRVPLETYDEGLALFNAMRVANGDVPFRDFWSIYPPGQSYTLAALFSIFGWDIQVARIYDTFVRFGIAASIFLLADRLFHRGLALFVSMVVVLQLAVSLFYAYAVFPALLFSLFGLLFLARYFDAPKRLLLVFAGAMIGISAAYRLDIAGYAAIATGLAVLLFEVRKRGGREFLAAGISGAALFFGFALVAFPLYLWLILSSGAVPAWQQLIMFPATVLHEVRQLPLPLQPPTPGSLNLSVVIGAERVISYEMWLRFYFPILVFGITAAVFIWKVLARPVAVESRARPDSALILAILLFGVFLFAQAISRFDAIHVLPTTIVALLAGAWLVSAIPRRLWRHPGFTVSTGVLIYLFTIPYTWLSVDRLKELTENFPVGVCQSELERAGCVFIPGDQEAAVRYIQDVVPQGQHIFVGNKRHDKLFVNDVGFYFLSNRKSATRYHELHPGLANTRPVQERIVAEIEDKQVPWIVLTQWRNPNEPNASAVSGNIFLLDEYLGRNFIPVERFGAYVVFRRALSDEK